MKQTYLKRINPNERYAGSVRAGALALGCLLIGGGTGAYLAFRATQSGAVTGAVARQGDVLSDQTKSMLAALQGPVEIRFYSILDPATATESEKALADRVNKLLREYQEKAGNSIKLTLYDKSSYAVANAAREDGIQPFNIEKGDACYLGLAVVRDGRKQTLPRLSAEWEHVFESDLTRAIAAVALAPQTPGSAPKADAAVVDQVRSAVPNVDAVSVEEGNRILREEALKQFKATAEELQRQVKAAQQAYVDAQARQSDSEKQAALKQMQEAQAAETEKLKEITARLQAQISALEQIKSPGR